MDFTVKGINYRAAKMDAFKQLHVARRVAPLAPALFNMIGKYKETTDLASLLANVESLFMPFIDLYAKLPDAEVDYVNVACLAVTHKQIAPNQYSPMVVNGQLMFADMQADDLLMIVFNVLMVNLGNFIPGLSGLNSAVISPTQ